MITSSSNSENNGDKLKRFDVSLNCMLRENIVLTDKAKKKVNVTRLLDEISKLDYSEDELVVGIAIYKDMFVGLKDNDEVNKYLKSFESGRYFSDISQVERNLIGYYQKLIDGTLNNGPEVKKECQDFLKGFRLLADIIKNKNLEPVELTMNLVMIARLYNVCQLGSRYTLLELLKDYRDDISTEMIMSRIFSIKYNDDALKAAVEVYIEKLSKIKENEKVKNYFANVGSDVEEISNKISVVYQNLGRILIEHKQQNVIAILKGLKLFSEYIQEADMEQMDLAKCMVDLSRLDVSSMDGMRNTVARLLEQFPQKLSRDGVIDMNLCGEIDELKANRDDIFFRARDKVAKRVGYDLINKLKVEVAYHPHYMAIYVKYLNEHYGFNLPDLQVKDVFIQERLISVIESKFAEYVNCLDIEGLVWEEACREYASFLNEKINIPKECKDRKKIDEAMARMHKQQDAKYELVDWVNLYVTKNKLNEKEVDFVAEYKRMISDSRNTVARNLAEDFLKGAQKYDVNEKCLKECVDFVNEKYISQNKESSYTMMEKDFGEYLKDKDLLALAAKEYAEISREFEEREKSGVVIDRVDFLSKYVYTDDLQTIRKKFVEEFLIDEGYAIRSYEKRRLTIRCQKEKVTKALDYCERNDETELENIQEEIRYKLSQNELHRDAVFGGILNSSKIDESIVLWKEVFDPYSKLQVRWLCESDKRLKISELYMEDDFKRVEGTWYDMLLRKSILQVDLDTMKFLLQNGIYRGVKKVDIEMVLEVAIRYKRQDLMILCVGLGADERKLLKYAIKNNMMELAKFCIECLGENIGVSLEDILASKRADLMEFYLRRGGDPDKALEYATKWHERQDMIRLCIEYGGNPDRALEYGTFWDDRDMIQFGLDRRANPDKGLEYAVKWSCRQDVIKLYLDYGGDPNGALEYGTFWDDRDILQFGLDRGADPNKGLRYAIKSICRFVDINDGRGFLTKSYSNRDLVMFGLGMEEKSYNRLVRLELSLIRFFLDRGGDLNEGLKCVLEYVSGCETKNVVLAKLFLKEGADLSSGLEHLYEIGREFRQSLVYDYLKELFVIQAAKINDKNAIDILEKKFGVSKRKVISRRLLMLVFEKAIDIAKKCRKFYCKLVIGVHRLKSSISKKEKASPNLHVKANKVSCNNSIVLEEGRASDVRRNVADITLSKVGTSRGLEHGIGR